MNILDQIAERTRERVAEQKRVRSLASMQQAADEALARDCERCAAEKPGPDGLPLSGEAFAAAHAAAPCSFPFEGALERPGVQFIAEVKRASPLKGLIAADFPYLQIARDYETAGAAAISCQTEPYWFQGRNEYLAEIAEAVSIPVLRKDFVVDEYMVYEAKALGAQAVLLICAILDDAQLAAYRQLCDQLRLSALVEAHTAKEIERAIACGARVIGVNNRDLRSFTVDINNSARLRKLVPPEILFVSESGIKTAADIEALRSNGTNAVLIGETLMRSPDKKAALDELRGHAI